MLKKNLIDFEKNYLGIYAAGVLCLVVYAGNFFFPLMDKDAAHHANIALNMVEHNDFIQLIDREHDYLDKPHLLFWASALSFKIFGVHTFAHRLPALLFCLFSLYSTFRLSAYLSNKTNAWITLLLLATGQSFFLSVTDARMEAPLTAFIIFSIWQMIVFADGNKLKHVFLGALGTALAFSTKGWIGPVVIFITVFFYLLIQRNWKILLRPKSWLFIPVFFLFICPVLYAYYVQYDLHPEKVIRGMAHRSGVRFILWDQLFERAGGFDVKERNPDYFFLFHTFLWSFFPWSILSYGALIFWSKRMVQKKWKHPFHFAVLSFSFVLFVISFSKFKMPHYIIMLLPLAALFTAPYLNVIFSAAWGKRWLYPLHLFFGIVILLLTIILNFYVFHPQNIFFWVVGPVVLLVFMWLFFSKFPDQGSKVFWVSISFSLLFNFYLNYNFFPNLLHYQGGNELVKTMDKNKLRIPDQDIILVELHAHSFDFYSQHNHHTIEVDQFPKEYPGLKDKYFLMSPFLADYVRKKGFDLITVASHIDYNVATLNFSFLNPATRNSTYDSLMLMKVYPKGQALKYQQ